MLGSKYARLNPFANSQQVASPIAEEPMNISSSVPDPAYDNLASGQISDDSLNSSSKKQGARLTVSEVFSPTTDSVAYTGFIGDIPSRPPREYYLSLGITDS